jgi:hypothetical protein
VWRDRLGEPVSPQVIVIERPIDTNDYLTTARIGVQNDRLVVDVTAKELVSWMKQGMPLNRGMDAKSDE